MKSCQTDTKGNAKLFFVRSAVEFSVKGWLTELSRNKIKTQNT